AVARRHDLHEPEAAGLHRGPSRRHATRQVRAGDRGLVEPRLDVDDPLEDHRIGFVVARGPLQDLAVERVGADSGLLRDQSGVQRSGVAGDGAGIDRVRVAALAAGGDQERGDQRSHHWIWRNRSAVNMTERGWVERVRRITGRFCGVHASEAWTTWAWLL